MQRPAYALIPNKKKVNSLPACGPFSNLISELPMSRELLISTAAFVPPLNISSLCCIGQNFCHSFQAFMTLTPKPKDEADDDPNPVLLQQPTSATGTSRRVLTTRVDDANISQPWTADHCHLLLRQLELRLATLRKLVSEAKTPKMPGRQSKRLGLGDDERQERKRVRYTYYSKRTKLGSFSQKSRVPAPHRSTRTFGKVKAGRAASPLAGQDHFPAPICRTAYHYDDERNWGNGNKTTNETPRHLLEEMQCLRNSRPERHYRVYSWIFDWLNQFLRSAGIKRGEPHRKSLLAMCLRKVPACVAEIEAWDRKTSQDEVNRSVPGTLNASLEIYGQLESFGYAGLGWQPLKHAARAHGVSILRDAVSDGLFEPIYVGLLVRLCAYHGCVDEAASLASAIPGTLPPPRNWQSSLDESSNLQPLGALLDVTICAEGKGHGAAFGIVSSLIKEKRLPTSWIPTKAFSTLLTSAVEAVTEGTCGSAALEFLATATEMLFLDDMGKCCEPQANNRQKTLITIAASLATAAMNVGDSEGPGGISPRESRRRLLCALDHGINRVRWRLRTGWESRVFALSLARFLAGSEVKSDISSGCNGERLRGLDGGSRSHSPDQYHQALHLACLIAQGRSRELPCPSHSCLIQVCHKLDNLSLPHWFVQGLTRDGAFLLAQNTKDPRDIAFAERQMHPVESTVQASPVFSGWRWEEGIGEWVMRSPETKRGTLVSEERADTSRGMAPDRTRPHTKRHPHQTDLGGTDEADRGGPASECGQGFRTSEGGSGRLQGEPAEVPLTGKPAMGGTVSEGYNGEQEIKYHARAAVVKTPAHGRRRFVKGISEGINKSEGGMGTQALQVVQGQGHEGKSGPTPAPIGGRRQLLIVRGRGEGMRDVDWLQW